MKQHTIAALLGIALGLLTCAIVSELARVALVALQAEDMIEYVPQEMDY